MRGPATTAGTAVVSATVIAIVAAMVRHSRRRASQIRKMAGVTFTAIAAASQPEAGHARPRDQNQTNASVHASTRKLTWPLRKLFCKTSARSTHTVAAATTVRAASGAPDRVSTVRSAAPSANTDSTNHTTPASPNGSCASGQRMTQRNSG